MCFFTTLYLSCYSFHLLMMACYPETSIKHNVCLYPHPQVYYKIAPKASQRLPNIYIYISACRTILYAISEREILFYISFISNIDISLCRQLLFFWTGKYLHIVTARLLIGWDLRCKRQWQTSQFVPPVYNPIVYVDKPLSAICKCALELR